MFANPAPYWRLVAHLGWQDIQEAAIIVNPPRHAQAGTIYARVPEAGPGRLAVSAVDRFFTDTHQFIRDARPSAHTLTARQEHELSARCIIMAVLEQSARTSPYRSGLLHSTDIHHPEDLFRLIRQPWIDDVTALARNAATVLDSQTDRPHTPNPTFDGSPDVGGADADIIIDTCLIDIKTTINPALKGEWLHQILSYTLLDYSDQHRIDRVAVLMPRQSTMPTWPISQFMDTLSNHRAQDLSPRTPRPPEYPPENDPAPALPNPSSRPTSLQLRRIPLRPDGTLPAMPLHNDQSSQPPVNDLPTLSAEDMVALLQGRLPQHRHLLTTHLRPPRYLTLIPANPFFNPEPAITRYRQSHTVTLTDRSIFISNPTNIGLISLAHVHSIHTLPNHSIRINTSNTNIKIPPVCRPFQFAQKASLIIAGHPPDPIPPSCRTCQNCLLAQCSIGNPTINTDCCPLQPNFDTCPSFTPRQRPT